MLQPTRAPTTAKKMSVDSTLKLPPSTSGGGVMDSAATHQVAGRITRQAVIVAE
ncbi:hypothetical protein [Mesorhizobium sp. M1396]|uniref:hypothetical protein n=1 Tax=Mesorhizobium sp. M1396 TaxID=2957095 RepID=UPI003338A645